MGSKMKTGNSRKPIRKTNGNQMVMWKCRHNIAVDKVAVAMFGPACRRTESRIGGRYPLFLRARISAKTSQSALSVMPKC